jgi:hypothetical protein
MVPRARHSLLAFPLLIGLGACTNDPNAPSPGEVFAGIVGTPFLIALKIPVCAATIAIAGPVGGMSSISNPADGEGQELRRNLGDGLVSNCGPPYIVGP